MVNLLWCMDVKFAIFHGKKSGLWLSVVKKIKNMFTYFRFLLFFSHPGIFGFYLVLNSPFLLLSCVDIHKIVPSIRGAQWLSGDYGNTIWK